MQTASEYDAAYEKCTKESDTFNNNVVFGCSSLANDKAREDITRLYNSIYSHLRTQSSQDARNFEASQKAWIKYRNYTCDLEGTYIGSPAFGICPMQMNAERATYLRHFFQDIGGAQEPK